MASRRERCGYCGVQLLVSPEAQAVRCPMCQGITRVQPSPLARAWEPINQVADHAKDLIRNISPMITNYSSMGNKFGYHYSSVYSQYPSPPPPPPPRPMFVPPSAYYGPKRAVLCGVTYRGNSYRLNGSVNDVKCMKYFLESLGFPSDCILVLTEEETDPKRIPTKQNVRAAMRWLVQGCESGESLVFHFSGHGTKQRDYNMDEVDGYDEAICPLDFETEGPIIDDEINETIVRPIPHGATLHAIVDACYSGTVLDLRYVCRMNREGYYCWEEQITRSYKGTSGGLALSFSACDDDDTSLDTTAFSGNAATGALTYSFIEAVQKEPSLTYGRLLTAMRTAIRSAKSGGLRLTGPIAAFVNKALFNSDISQEPQLSSSEKFEIYSKQFVL